MSSSSDARLGTAMIVASAAAYSLAGYFTRLIDLDVWTILFWRGLFGGLLVGACVAWCAPRGVLASLRAMGRPGLWVTGLSTFATICFINALRIAPVADVITIQAAVPLMAAVLSHLLLGEREHWTTWLASYAALVGIAIVLNPQGSPDHLAGVGLSMMTALAYATMMVVIRRHRQVSMLPAAGLSAFLCALAAWPFARTGTATGTDMVALFLFGSVQFGLGLVFMTLGTRLISATRAALIGLLENPLAPLWVWLAFGEKPSATTWLGGGIVTAAVLLDALATARRNRRAAAGTPSREFVTTAPRRWRLSEVRRVRPTAEDMGPSCRR